MTNWNDLKKLSKMETFEDVQEFEKQIWALVETKDPYILEKLMDLFDDECDHPEVMYGLIHAMETYPDDIYIVGILKKLPDGLKNYHEWYKRLIYRLLNEDICLKLFRQHMHLADRESLLKLFDVMETESPHHVELIQELREELMA